MIGDEAVEAAATAVLRGMDERHHAYKIAYAALEAAAPYIAAAALREAADAFENLPVNKGAEISSGTWDRFELFPIQHIRVRAEEIRASNPYRSQA